MSISLLMIIYEKPIAYCGCNFYIIKITFLLDAAQCNDLFFGVKKASFCQFYKL